ALLDQERTNQLEQGLVNPNIRQPKDFEKWRENIRSEFDRRLITDAQKRKLLLEVDRQQMRFERKSLYSTPKFTRTVANRYFASGDRDELLKALESKRFDRGTANVVRSLMETDLAIKQAQSKFTVLEGTLKHLDSQVALYTSVVKNMAKSPFVEAANTPVAMAFLPHANRSHLGEETAVYSCRFYFFWCHRVGAVRSQHPDEVSGTHPFFNHGLRGTYLEIAADDVVVAEKPLLFLGRPPFLW
ncbi:hypothetical protein K2X33_12580, partial [bacterium]|nr:hypothetical protein [bacterium]